MKFNIHKRTIIQFFGFLSYQTDYLNKNRKLNLSLPVKNYLFIKNQLNILFKIKFIN